MFGKTEYVTINGILYKKYTPPWIKGPRPITTYTPQERVRKYFPSSSLTAYDTMK